MCPNVLIGLNFLRKKYSFELSARLVGNGLPLSAVRAAFLPPDELLSTVPLNKDRYGRPHEEPTDENPTRALMNPAYMRRHPVTHPIAPGEADLLDSVQIAHMIQVCPVKGTDITESEIGYPYGDFSRATDEDGNAMVGKGAFISEELEVPRELWQENSAEEELSLARREHSRDDASGVTLLFESAAERPLSSYEEMRAACPLPLPAKQWREIFAPY